MAASARQTGERGKETRHDCEISSALEARLLCSDFNSHLLVIIEIDLLEHYVLEAGLL